MNKNFCFIKYAKYTTSALFISSALLYSAFTSLQADDSAETTIKNSGEDIKASTKKTVRKVNRNIRKATDTDTFGKDVKDSVNDFGDDAQKNKNKIKNELNDTH